MLEEQIAGHLEIQKVCLQPLNLPFGGSELCPHPCNLCLLSSDLRQELLIYFG
jgi:hypothetical protein